MNVKNGDVIRVNRGLYSHYGIYVEGGKVIHYTGATGPNDFNGIVRETSLEEFLNGSKNFNVCSFPEKPKSLSLRNFVHKNKILYQLWQLVKKSRLKNYHLYSGDETVERAKSQLGKGGYNLALNNCEHFAVWCKTGVKDSSQVDNIIDVITYFLS